LDRHRAQDAARYISPGHNDSAESKKSSLIAVFMPTIALPHGNSLLRHGAPAMVWPADIGEQMAAVHRIYPIVETAADPKLVELLKFVEASESSAD
jgi:hypothetical protein